MTEHIQDAARVSSKIAMVGDVRGTLPTITSMQPWQLRVLVDDDSLAPVIANNTAVVVDCSDRSLTDGEIYAVRHDASVRLWLYLDGFGGVGTNIGETPIGTLSSLAGGFRCEAALERSAIPVVGRCIGQLDGEAQTIDPLIMLERERQVLLSSRERLIAKDGGSQINDMIVPPNVESRSAASLRNWLQHSMTNQSFAQSFKAQQRLDAITGRLMLIEDRMSRQVATSLAGVEAQLDMLWDVHYAPFPEDLEELAALTIKAARRSIKNLNGSSDAMRVDDASGAEGVASIKIVPSPRHFGG